ncbi:hypothetical protein Pcinc_012654 [Petrolisthes cinctipes]|uniref:Uncharacterized protein n=1 Tax=Petrolisthes cinctipes TaxID=88211 RepID=A0AAE1FYG3_PETCI|nr:hypothetical protein Pcinc_012654 [Petrolisthes cinctipes]
MQTNNSVQVLNSNSMKQVQYGTSTSLSPCNKQVNTSPVFSKEVCAGFYSHIKNDAVVNDYICNKQFSACLSPCNKQVTSVSTNAISKYSTSLTPCNKQVASVSTNATSKCSTSLTPCNKQVTSVSTNATNKYSTSLTPCNKQVTSVVSIHLATKSVYQLQSIQQASHCQFL